MKGFLINLDASENRLKKVDDRLLASGVVRISDSPVRWQKGEIVIERLSAVDGRKMSEGELQKMRQDKRAFWDWTTHDLRPGEMGCFLSHRKFWQKVVQEKLPRAFVIEDDILLSEDFFQMMSSEDWIPSDADYVKLDLSPANKSHEYPVSEPKGLVCGREIRRMAGRIYGTGCYVISLNAARECLARSEKLGLPVDLFMFDSRFDFAPEKVIYTVLPGVAVDEGGDSTIGGTRNKDQLSVCQHLLKGFYSTARRIRLNILMKKHALTWVKGEFQS